MARGRNKAFLVAGIRNLMITNYQVNPSLIDVEALVDSTLSFTENWSAIKPKVIVLCNKPSKFKFS